MLRINQNSSVDRAKSYYSTADYYLEGQELTGRWRGQGARLLGLEGTVEQLDWDQLCENRDPETGKRLTLRTNADRTIGYDFNFHVPKSVSLLYALTREERILDAFRDAVDGTMQAIEEEMSARVRKGKKNSERRTGNMAWGEFVHFTSRPVNGLPDPHLHAHCFAFNVTHDEQEQAWKAGQFRELKRDAPYFEAVFHARLAHRLSEVGLPIARTKHGWELGGVTKPLIQKFSRRTKQIEDKAREMGIEDPELKSELGAKTRERKQKNLTMPQLHDAWRSRMSPQEIDALAALARRVGGDAEPVDANASARALDFAIEHAFARQSTVPERELLASALRHGVGQASVDDVLREAARSDLIIGERNGRRMATTQDVLAEERRMIGFAREGRGACEPLARAGRTLNRDRLSAEQQRAVEHITRSRDRVILLRGAAGVGKTTLMREAVESIEESGKKVFAFAPSADASRGTLRDAGFQEAETVAMLLANPELQRQVAGQLIWIDEAGQLGTQTMAEIFSLAEQLDARVLLSGDRFQHGSVERGAALRLLEQEAGLVSAEVKEIKRQSGQYKEAVKALSEGRVEDGFRRLDDLGAIREIPDADRDRQLAADYVAIIRKGKTALVVSPTHLEGDRITTEIRKSLRAAGKLGEAERPFSVLVHANLTLAERGDAVNYLPGDVLVFHQNAKGFTRGQRVKVMEGGALPFEEAKRFQLYHARTLKLAAGDVVRITKNGQTADGQHRLNNGALYRVSGFDRDGNVKLDNGWTIGRTFGHLAHGYVVTSHASQSKTVDEVFIGQSSYSFPASSREQFYVSASRAKSKVRLYTDDKQALLEAISHSDERLSATELVNANRQRDVVTLQRERERSEPPVRRRDREGQSHDR
jgi:conjugative relaxase-like TrwC/TraI family protein